MLAPLVGMFGDSKFWETVATLASGIAAYASQRAAKPPVEPLDDLTERLRRPVRWSLKHPLLATRRAMRRRDRE